MPLHGCNRIEGGSTSCSSHCVSNATRGFDCQRCQPLGEAGSWVGSHAWFEQFELEGDEVMRYFLEPVCMPTPLVCCAALDVVSVR